MKTIVMDSANKYLVVALYENQKCLASLQEEGNRKQSEYAIVYLQKLLQENYLKMSDFDETVFTLIFIVAFNVFAIVKATRTPV